MKTALSIFIGTLLIGEAWSQQVMTLKQFEELVATPCDEIALRAELAALPHWRESRGNYTVTYQDGTKVTDKCTKKTKTVGGKWIIFGINWGNSQTIDYSILGYDERASAIRHWGIVDGILVQGTTILDINRKAFAETSSCAGGIMQISVGIFSDKELSLRTQCFRDGVLFFTSEWNEHAITAANKTEQAGAGQPATKPADKAPAEIQPPTPTSKDHPR